MSFEERFVSVDGIPVNGNENRIRNQVDRHACAGALVENSVISPNG